MKLVVVEWKDARKFSSSFGYTMEECLEFKLAFIRSTGYLLREDDEVILLATEERLHTNRFDELTLIPASEVISIKVLRTRNIK